MKRTTVLTLALASALAAGSSAFAADPLNLRFATVGVGSAWYNYGAGIAAMVTPKLPDGSRIEVLPVAGGVGNIKLLQAGEAELGISFPMPAAEGCQGYGSFDTPHDKVRGLVGGLDTYYFGTLVRADSELKSWDDIIAGKGVLLTTKVGGTGETGVRQVLALMGSSKDDVRAKGGEVKAMARQATATAISDNQAQGWSHVVTRGHPVATQLTTLTDMHMLPLPEAVRTGLVEKHGWVIAEIPAGTFKGQDAAVKTVKAASNILVSESMPDDIAYIITKTIIENAAELRKIHAGLSDFDTSLAPNAGLLGNCPLHPGAAKYYKEAGLL